MSLQKMLFTTIALAALLQGCATATPQTGTIATARIESIFIEEYPGLFLDDRIATGVRGPRWARVAFDPSLPDGRVTAVALIEGELHVERGDSVAVRVAEENAPAADSSTVTAVLARNRMSVTADDRP